MYQFPLHKELLQAEQEQFSEHFSVDIHGRRVYDSIDSAEKAHSNLQIQEMRKYARDSGIILDEIHNTKLLAEICSSWITQYAQTFAEFWESTHKKVPSLTKQ